MSVVSMIDNPEKQAFDVIDRLKSEINRHVVTEPDELHAVIGACIINGAVLLEGPPGTGKTLEAKVLAEALGGTHGRVQGGPDLVPADIVGTRIFDHRSSNYHFEPGPVFANVFHFDEINRASPKTQSALLEVMEERQVTVGGETHPVPRPFLVIATQNPNESQAGTYLVTQANLDRFAVGLFTRRYDRDKRLAVRQKRFQASPVRPVVDPEEIQQTQHVLVDLEASMPANLLTLTEDILDAAYKDESIDKAQSIISVRSQFAINSLAQFNAMAHSRRTPEAEDIAFGARFALPHRLVLSEDTWDKGDISPQLIVANAIRQVITQGR